MERIPSPPSLKLFHLQRKFTTIATFLSSWERELIKYVLLRIAIEEKKREIVFKSMEKGHLIREADLPFYYRG